jgi:hypothetical protein
MLALTVAGNTSQQYHELFAKESLFGVYAIYQKLPCPAQYFHFFYEFQN